LAQYNLGLAYELGNGVEIDPLQAIEWYVLSHSQGFNPAQKRLKNLQNKLIDE